MSAYRILAAILLVVTVISCEGPTGPAGPPGKGIESLSDPSVMPKVIYTYPRANTTGPYPELYRYDCVWDMCRLYSQFQVRFNKYMDVTSVRRAVKLSSSLGDIHADTNFILSVGGDVFLLDPVDSNGYRYDFRFRVGETYTIGVDSTARDINGNALAPPFTANFVPEPSFRVVETSPANGATDVAVYISPSLWFNSTVPPSILSHISIEPAIPGYWYLTDYYDSSTAVFQPAGNLPTATEFTITVDESATDVRGNRIPAPFTCTFTTIPFRVTYTFPSNGAAGVPLSASPSMTFSVPIDTSTFTPAFHITPATTGTILGLSSWTTNVIFDPRDGLLASTSYTVRLDSTLLDKEGSRLSGGYEFSFTTAPFTVLSTTPTDGASGVARFNAVVINLNGFYDPATVAGSVQITPPAATSIIPCDRCTSFYFYASSGLAMNTTYMVTIGTGLRTKRGEPLPAPYSFSFTTGPN